MEVISSGLRQILRDYCFFQLMSIALYGEIILVASTATGLNFYESASAALREKHEVAAWNFGTISEENP
jgi:CO dehydrogenase/acetyl-CoA synthase delta subunit